jgi:Protein of unknown function (DUF1566)
MRLTVSMCILVLITWGTTAAAISDADKCEAAKNKIAGKYAFCRQKAEAKAIKTGAPVDYSKCDTNFGGKWATAETRGGGMCPTRGDQSGIQNQVTAAADSIALKLTGVRFVDNGDGTVTDVQAGLMWEQKTGDSTVHDKDNLYTWSATGKTPDGTAFTTFLGTLNHGTSGDGNTIGGCFAGQCDWRLPTNAELQTILLAPFSCGTTPCIDPIFGPTQSFFYWSATTGDPGLAWFVDFSYGFVFEDGKTNNFYVRAVRNGL